MKTHNLVLLFGLGLALLGAGCGPSRAERERLELEAQQNREIRRANEAITHMTEKLGRKASASDLGLLTEPSTTPKPSKAP